MAVHPAFGLFFVLHMFPPLFYYMFIIQFYLCNVNLFQYDSLHLLTFCIPPYATTVLDKIRTNYTLDHWWRRLEVSFLFL